MTTSRAGMDNCATLNDVTGNFMCAIILARNNLQNSVKIARIAVQMDTKTWF